jgi:alkaline phosphatase
MSDNTGTTDAAAMVSPVKNIIVMIADGAGFNTIEATRLYLEGLDAGDPRGGVGSIVTDGPGFVASAQSTYPLDVRTTPIEGAAGLEQNPLTVYDPAQNYDATPVAGVNAAGYERAFAGYDWNRATYPDSANTASAIATGAKSYNNAIDVDGSGHDLANLAEMAHLLGKSTGVVSTVQFSDATPAATGGANNISRANRAEIANEMFSDGTLDVIGGTGNPDYTDDGTLRSSPVYDWVDKALWTALKDGSFRADDGGSWELLQSRADIQAAATGTPTEGRLAMVAQAFTGTNFYRAGGEPATEQPFSVPRLETSPTLTEMTHAALNRLDADDDGFYLSIEGGAVDRAMHANNFGRMIEEQIEFNDTIKFVLDYINSPDSKATLADTLIIVTADHDHLLFGPEGATIPFQPVQPDRNGDGVPEYQWFSNNHSNQVVPLYAIGAEANAVGALADKVDAVIGAGGERLAGSQRLFTDQADLGDFLLEELDAGATPVKVDWDALAAQVFANYAATGTWYL